MTAEAEKLLTRDEFRTGVFERDNHVCVVPGCGLPAVDAHHIMERRLWTKEDPYPEGYLLSNGSSLCERHHRHAENGFICPQAIRHWLDLPTILPIIMNPLCIYDKWGNEIASAGTGENTKYPKTPYLPFSPSIDQDDRTIDLGHLVDKPLVVTVKMDGSCVTLTQDHVAARNGQTANKPSFDFLKAQYAQRYKVIVPNNMQLFGEWLFAQHSIEYRDGMALDSFLQFYAVYDRLQELFLGWPDLVSFCEQNDVRPVPFVRKVSYNAEWKLVADLTAIAQEVIAAGHEGIVVRSEYPFHFTQFGDNVCKYVREGHIQTDDTWGQKIVKNELKS